MKTPCLRVAAPRRSYFAPRLLPAQNVKLVADREAARRQARIPQGEDLAARGQTELADHQFAQAHEDFRLALNYIPPSNGSYQRALDGFCESGVKLAEQRTRRRQICGGRANPHRSGERSLQSELPRSHHHARPSARSRIHQQDDGAEVHRQGRGSEKAALPKRKAIISQAATTWR